MEHFVSMEYIVNDGTKHREYFRRIPGSMVVVQVLQKLVDFLTYSTQPKVLW